jgi:hypothetical protein
MELAVNPSATEILRVFLMNVPAFYFEWPGLFPTKPPCMSSEG